MFKTNIFRVAKCRYKWTWLSNCKNQITPLYNQLIDRDSRSHLLQHKYRWSFPDYAQNGGTDAYKQRITLYLQRDLVGISVNEKDTVIVECLKVDWARSWHRAAWLRHALLSRYTFSGCRHARSIIRLSRDASETTAARFATRKVLNNCVIFVNCTTVECSWLRWDPVYS